MILVFTGIVGYIGSNASANIYSNLDSLYSNHLLSIGDIKQANIDLYTVRLAIHKAILESDPANIQAQAQKISDGDARVKADLADFEKRIASQEVRDGYNNLVQSYDEYFAEISKVIPAAQANKDEEAFAALQTAATRAAQVDQDVEKLVQIKESQAGTFHSESGDLFSQSRLLILGLTIAAVLLGIGVAFFMSRDISRPLAVLTMALEHIQHGDLNRDMTDAQRKIMIDREDEIGRAGKAESQTGRYLREMADAANHIAAGDLTVSVTPKSEKDELGHAFAQMIERLRQSVGQIAESAGTVGAAAAQLSSAANQAGEATSQIALTIQQVARGTAQQSQSISMTSQSMEQMSRAIEGVAKGAQDQASSIGKASTDYRANQPIGNQVADNAQAVTRDSAQAAQAAKDGTKPFVRPSRAWKHQGQGGSFGQKVQEMGTDRTRLGRSWRRSTISPRRPTCWRSMRPSKRRGPGNTARASRWWPTKCANWRKEPAARPRRSAG